MLFGEFERSFNPQKAFNRGTKLLPDLVKAEIVLGVGHSMEGKESDWMISRIIPFLEEFGVPA